MIQQIKNHLISLAVLASVFGGSTAARACTGIRLNATDGAVVYARTMEFALELGSNVLIVPRNYAFTGTARTGKPGLEWKAKYAAVGMNAQNQPILVDGVNEKGLASGAFYFPGYAKYQEVGTGDETRAVGNWELVTFILTNFATVDEVQAGLGEILVGAATPPGWDSVPPAHFIVHDAQGNSLVIEYVAGKLNTYHNPIGVITNSPDFPWHVTNLNNYVNLSPVNSSAFELDGIKVAQTGQGSGLLGIPGDFTPPSRFVRAALFSQFASPSDNGTAAVQQAFHILDSFDITKGDVRDVTGNTASLETTQWTAASDTRNCVYYFHTHDNRRIRQVNLLEADLDATEPVIVPVVDQQDFENVTPVAGRNHE